MKTMSIIGIIWFSISLFCIIGFSDTNVEAAMGWGVLGMLYAIPFSIVVLVKTKNKVSNNFNLTEKLLKLSELKEKGIINDAEFEAKKIELLKIYNP